MPFNWSRVVGQWFNKYRAAAIGLAFAGIGIGNVVFPPVVNIVVKSLGWRTTMQILAIPSLLILAAAVILRQRLPMSPISMSSIKEVGKDKVFIFLSIAGFLVGYGYLMPFVYIVTFSKAIGIGADNGAYLLCIMGGASAIGRISLGFLSDKFGKVKVFTFNMLVMPATYIIWIYMRSFGGK